MSDEKSRFEDLERTDVLPQLGFEPDDEDSDRRIQPRIAGHRASDAASTERLPAPFGTSNRTRADGVQTLPAKLSTTDLAVGGIRGKIVELEGKLLEAQEHQIDLN